MTPDRTDETPDEGTEHGVLDDSGTLDTASISVLGGHIAQVSVDLPVTDDEDVDDDVVEDEMPVIDAESRAFEVVGIVHIPDVDEPPLLTHVPDPEVAAATDDSDLEELPTGDIILEPHDEADLDGHADAEVHDAEIVHDDDAEAESEVDESDAEDDDERPDAEPADAAIEPEADGEPADGEPEVDVEPEVVDEAEVVDGPDVVDEPEVESVDAEGRESDDAALATAVLEEDELDDVETDARVHEDDEPADHEPVVTDAPGAEPDADAGIDTATDAEIDAHAAADADAAPSDATDEVDAEGATSDRAAAAPAGSTEPADASPLDAPVSATAAAVAATAAAGRGSVSESAAPTTGPVPRTRAERAATGVIGTVPLTRREVHHADEAARVGRAHAAERVRTPGADVTLASKRLGEIDDTRESPDLLTADRLLDPRQIARPEPEGLWQQLVYSVSRHRINLGDGRRARARKDLDRRISAPLSGEPRFVPVLSRKGGVGKTTITSLLGMALADARDDRVIAVDANPDRGTLADRVGRANGRTVRDLVRAHDDVTGYGDVSSIVARDATRLDVLASDSDPRVSEAFSDEDYRRVADVAAHYYSIVLTDTGTGIVHSVMEATLELSDALVVVAGLSVDEARLASETLTWLETNGYADRVRNAVVVLNNARPGAPLVRESELEAHFRSRVRSVIRMPYDAHVATGSAIAFRDLQPATRQSARELAAAVVEGLRTPAAAA